MALGWSKTIALLAVLCLAFLGCSSNQGTTTKTPATVTRPRQARAQASPSQITSISPRVTPRQAGPARPTPVARITAIPSGTKSASCTPVFQSRTSPYALCSLANWYKEVRPVIAGSVEGDLFTGSGEQNKGNTIVVLSEELPNSSINTHSYVTTTVAALRQDDGASPREASRSIRVGSNDAEIIIWVDYSRPLEPVYITQAIWTAGGRGWVVTLRSPHDNSLSSITQLRSFLGGFRVTR